MLFLLSREQGFEHPIMMFQNFVEVVEDFRDELLDPILRDWRGSKQRFDEYVLYEFQIVHIVPFGRYELEDD